MSLITANTTIIFKGLDLQLKLKSYHAQYRIIRVKASLGPVVYILVLIGDSFGFSLVRSFKASAIGWVTPKTSTLLGPLR